MDKSAASFLMTERVTHPFSYSVQNHSFISPELWLSYRCAPAILTLGSGIERSKNKLVRQGGSERFTRGLESALDNLCKSLEATECRCLLQDDSEDQG